MVEPSDILTHMRGQREAFSAFLESLVLCESPSDKPATQQAVHTILREAFVDLGFKVTSLPGRNSGGHLYARPRKRPRHLPRQMMVGHYDTVWPEGTLKTMPLSKEEAKIAGPGIYDMKSGVTQMIFALRALRDLGGMPSVIPFVFLNSDEEIGSRESTRWIKMLSQRAVRVFVLEPSLGPTGKLKTTRKGVGRFTITAKGKAAHAGLDPEAGASAILEMAHVIQSLFALNDPVKGITVNVGTVDGGLRPNVIAPQSSAVVDVRTRTIEDGEAVAKAIHSLKAITPGVVLEIDGRIGRPAMMATDRNKALWQLAQEKGRELGLELEEDMAGGGSDGNTTSQYTATLDGLGAVGAGAHARNEHINLDLTLDRAALLASLLLAPNVTV